MKLIKLHPAQSKVFKDTHRFKVMVCGRRFGKTTLSITALIKEALEKEGKYWYVAPTYRQAKQIAWDMLTRLLQKIEWVVKRKNETELSIELVNGSKIELKGADNEDSLRGVGLNGVIMDEYAQIKPRVFEEIIRPTLTDTKGWAWFIGTPQGFNHFYEMSNKQDKDYATFHFTSFDNPYLDHGEIAKAQEELTENAFNQEYLAKFTKFTGLVYPDFDRGSNVIKPFDIPPDWSRFRSIDFGYNNPFACLWFAIDSDSNIYITDEFYQSHTTTRGVAETIKGRSVGVNIRQTFGDPSAKQLIADFAGESLYIIPANNDVQGGIAKVSQYVKKSPATGKPRLFVFNSCINTIREFETYHWQDKKEGNNEKEEPVKENDHCLVGDTEILMSNNEFKKLKNIKIGEYVYTSNGINKVLLSRKTRKKQRIYKLILSNGYEINGTGDHKIYTKRGIIGIDSLRYDDIIETEESIWKKQLFSIIKDITGIVDTIHQSEDIKTVEKDCIKQFGSIILDQYQKDFTFTIKTEIPEIIKLIILNLLHLRNIYQNIIKRIGNQKNLEKKLKRIVIMLDTFRKYGIVHHKALNGIKNTGKIVGLKEKLLLKSVKYVKKNIKHIYQNYQDSVIKIVKRERYGVEDVYNLTVENDHNYYANGLLVKNCMDATRYFIHTYTEPSSQYDESEYKPQYTPIYGSTGY